jgi:phenylpropionate dioxygenase-like ring-hydroxylating dioxygenase large terminal subunit
MATTKSKFLTETYGGYYHRDVPSEDAELTHVGPGTPCGEYLRRFWHPVAISNELKDLPHAIKIMGEELVVFRDKRGQVGLLELHCSHRGTSLEFGLIEEKGIRCCYHGWQFDVDGRILDTPGEPPDSTYKERLCHGAYPVHEYHGLVFAYMGPPNNMPPFPIYDIFEMLGSRLLPGTAGQKNIKPCNWLQIMDNVPDLVHEAFLHVSVTGSQFVDETGRPLSELEDVGEYDFLETPRGTLSLQTRRIGDHIWSRQLECMLPNMSVLCFPPALPPAYRKGQLELCVLPKILRWRVPIDDTNTMELHVYRAREWDETDVEPMQIAEETNAAGRPYQDRQRQPGDFDAQVGQRPIAVHDMEHLGSTDRGVIMYRNMIRDGIRAVENGTDPKGVIREFDGVIHLCGNDTAVYAPPATTPNEDSKLLHATALQLAERYLKTPPALHKATVCM